MEDLKTEIKEKEATSPILTFDPFGNTENEVAVVEETDVAASEEKKADFDYSILSEEERKMVDEFAEKIDIADSNMVLQFGAGAQKKIADFSENALENVRTKDLGEVGNMLSGVVTELKSFDSGEQQKGFLGIFKKQSNAITSMRAKYAKAESNIDVICTTLEKHQVTLLKDVAMLDRMYEKNQQYFKELSMYILAGKKKLQHAQETELPELVAKSNASGLPEDAQAVNDFTNLINRFEKKIHDLELTRMVSLQMAPQIRLVQNNDTLMAEKIQSTLVNTIPLWKSQIVLALGVAHSSQAAAAQREVTDMTNELLRKNAETLKMATIETAKESERGIVDVETIKHTNETLIATFDEVLRIQTEGREKRRQAEEELKKIETELKNKLLETSRR